MVATGSTTSFHCSLCQCEFEPLEGGHCGACGRLFCSQHLPHDRPEAEPNRARALCDVCYPGLRSAGSNSTSSDAVSQYAAIVWSADSTEPGKRLVLQAASIEEAEQQIRGEYGDGCVFSLWNEADASAPR